MERVLDFRRGLGGRVSGMGMEKIPECWEKEGKGRREYSGVLGEEGSDPGKRPRSMEHWGILGSPLQGIPTVLLLAGSGTLLALGRDFSLSHSPGLGAQSWNVYPYALPKIWKAPEDLLATNPSIFSFKVKFPH